MFYSHEILTSRKYGVATVWLVATLGAKSNTRKVTKKAILDVDVKKACETIIQPEAPMALRLQSNLLYGVSKVYNQQWEYLLVDTQAAQTMLRTLIKITRNNNELDLNAGKAQAHPDQLIMMDDPAFAIDMPVPPVDFDFTNLDLNAKGDSQRSSQSMLSIRGRSGSVVSHTSSVLGLKIPSSNSGSYQLPHYNPFGDSSAQKPFGSGPVIFNDEDGMVLQDDDLFDFDAEGMLRDIPASEREARRAGSTNPQRRLGSDSAASGRVRKEHEDALASRALQGLDGDGDFSMPLYGDDDLLTFPNAHPFPVMTGGLGGSDRPLHLSNEDRVFNISEESSVSAEAPMRKEAKKAKTMKIDQVSMLNNSTIISWQIDYAQNMAAGTRIKVNHQASFQAKKNALHYVYGSGISGVGDGIGSAKFVSPLAMFSGDALLAEITGKLPPKPKSKKRAKLATPDDKQDETPNKRTREDEVGRGNYGDDIALNIDDEQYQHLLEQSVEVGRDAPSALAEHPPSAMPWNMSSSLHSHQRGQSSSIQGRIGILGSQHGSITGRRLTSPLIGRGSTIPGDLDHFSQMMDGDDMVMYGRSDDGLGISSQASEYYPNAARSSSQAAGVDDFEIYGAAAGVDTQTAGSSQWMKNIMDQESNNFLDFVQNTISERLGDELGDGDDAVNQVEGITFDELIPPKDHSCLVAAQAFYHVLSLATKRRVWVEQDADDELLEPFGEIRIGVVV